MPSLSRVRRCSTALLLGLAALPAAAGTYDEHNSNDATLARIKSLSVRQTATPTLTVQAKGDKYDTVPLQGFSVGYEGAASCRGAWDLHWLKVEMDTKANAYVTEPKGESGVYSKVYIPHNVDSGDGYRSFSDTFGEIAVNDTVRNDALKRCNDALEQRIAGGKSRDEALAQEVLLKAEDRQNPPFLLEAWLLCGEADGGNIFFTRAWQRVKINHRCEAKPLPPPPPKPVEKPNLPFGAPFQVMATKLMAVPQNFTGPCPVDIEFLGRIAVNKPGLVEYRWLDHQGALSPVHKLQFHAAGELPVSTRITLGKNGKGPGFIQGAPQPKQLDQIKADVPEGLHQGWLKLVTLAPNQTESAPAHYKAQCVKPAPPPQPQPQIGQLTLGQADLTAGPELKLGDKPVNWGGQIALDAQAATGKRRGQCQFRFAYEQRNQGALGASGYGNVLRNGVQKLHGAAQQKLGPGQSGTVSGQLSLADGQHLLKLSIDDGKTVAESDETDNAFEVQVTVRGCTEPAPQ